MAQQEPMDASRDPLFPGEYVERNSAAQGDDMAKEGSDAAANGEEATKEGHGTARDGEDSNSDGHEQEPYGEPVDDQGWRRVERRKSRSRGRNPPTRSLRRHVSLDDNYFNNIRSAYVNLNDEERERLRRRETALAAKKGNPAPRAYSPSPEAGPSKPKGKAIDLGNLNRQEQARILAYWNVRKARNGTPGTGSNAVPIPENIPDRESTEVRRRLNELESENRALRETLGQHPPHLEDEPHRRRRRSKKKESRKDKGKKRASSQLLPSNQIPGKSLLGRVFKQPDDSSDSSDSSYQSPRSDGLGSGSSSSSSSSSSSDSDGSSSDSDGSSSGSSSDQGSSEDPEGSESDSSSSTSHRRRRRSRFRSRSRSRNGRARRHGRNERRRRRQKERKPLLWPTPPMKYNGEPDLFARGS
ncbi:hypothetical protein PLEOSDRAFT_169296 [Pleurotus ostreatus PC15]|uniref:Uncharacterized protein n=1 Tax=Pleurotus ostreatus (strain PC15) TaxID=1137138 RepID=A0A067NM87_PLEO1|nr:hypothetical protein PLEOSDRAFT_169296 [Pleurotus ostreatus PC15]